MKLTFLKSKVHRATVTGADLNYQGSITMDRALLEAAQIHAFEQVDVYNVTNGERFTTYAIAGEKGEICVNGAAAWKVKPGDLVIIACYAQIEAAEAATFAPRLVYVGAQNQIEQVTSDIVAKTW